MQSLKNTRTQFGNEERQHDDAGDDGNHTARERPTVKVFIDLGEGIQLPQLLKSLHGYCPVSSKGSAREKTSGRGRLMDRLPNPGQPRSRRQTHTHARPPACRRRGLEASPRLA